LSSSSHSAPIMQQKRYLANIFKNVPAPLAQVEHYGLTEYIQRFAPAGFPVHVAIHAIAGIKTCNETDYSAPHVHLDRNEINLLISNGELVYAITLGEETHEVAAPATIWIPAGLRHASNVRTGEGFFVCIQFDRHTP